MPRARIEARTVSPIWALWHMAGLLVAMLALAITAAPGRADETIIRSHGISAFGDLKYGPDFEHFDYVNPEAPKGGEISTWAFGTFDSLSPYILKGNAAVGAGIFFDSLMAGTMDEPDAMYGLVAESVEYPESREWAIFTIRPEAQFWDGTKITAEDVVFSFEVLRDKGQPTYKVLFRDFVSAEALDAARVKFTFNPEGALRETIMTAAGLPIFSKAYYSKSDFADSTLREPLGSGPYRLDKISPGQSVSYKRREDYWAKDLPVNVGQNNFDLLKFEYFTDYTSAFEAFKGGAYSFREEFLSKLWAKAYEFPAIEKGWVKVEQLPDGRPAGTQGFFFNLRREKFADPRVREALGMALNFEWSNVSLFYDLYNRTDSFWENSPMQAEGMIGPEEQAILEPFRGEIPETVFTEPAYVPPVSNPRSAGDRKTLRAAGKLLDAAGWAVGDDGIRRNAAGERLSVEFLYEGGSFDRIVLPYVENLKRLGVDAIALRVDAAQAQEREKKFDFDIVTRRYAMSFTPGIELRGIFGSESADLEGSNNIMGLKNPAVDALIVKIIEAESREELEHTVRALDRVLRALHIWVPQWYNGKHNIAYFDMFERPYDDTPPPLAVGEMAIWWFNPEKAAKLEAAGALQ